jgi:hypothetical protein
MTRQELMIQIVEILKEKHPDVAEARLMALVRHHMTGHDFRSATPGSIANIISLAIHINIASRS